MTTPAKAAFSEEIWKVSRKMRTLFDARVRAKGLTLARARALMFLGRNGCMTQTELADLLEILPEPEARPVAEMFRELMAGIAGYREPETGMYYQVPDQGSRPGNYLETSGSSMVAYAMLKGARLGFLPKEYAAKGAKTFDGIVRTKLHFDGESLNLEGICLVAGLGPEDNRRRNGKNNYCCFKVL